MYLPPYTRVRLAGSGIGCVRVADLFHALRALGRPMGRALGTQYATLQKQHNKLEKTLNQSSDGSTLQSLQSKIESNIIAQQRLQHDQQSYQEAIEQISQLIHPFTLDNQQWQTGNALLTHLAPPLQSLWNLAQSYGGEKAQKAIDTFEDHIDSWAQGIDAWRQWVTLSLHTQTPDQTIRDWVLMALLPWVYWTQQADKTRQPALKHRYQQAASTSFDKLLAQSLTLQLDDNELKRWVLWCQDFCTKYQRTSSAVEGRNGYLSKLHHASRGFSEQSLKALTVIHNFDLKRPDGTTAAQRLFDHPFPDVFEWMLEHIGDLPMPRKSSKAHQLNPSYANGFAA